MKSQKVSAFPSIKLDVLKNYQKVKVYYDKKIPKKITDNKILIKIFSKKIDQNTIVFQLPEKLEKKPAEYSLILKLYKKENYILKSLKKIFKKKANRNTTIEVIRQNPEYLKRYCKIDYPSGYFVLGRTSGLELPKSVTYHFKDIVVRGTFPKKTRRVINNIHFNQLKDNLPEELIISAKIMTFLKMRRFKNKISTLTYDDYMKLPIQKKISKKMVIPGSFSCQWLRDLFLEILNFFPFLKARSLDAFNLESASNSLIASSHAVCEVFCNKEKQWILVDPWNSCFFKDKENNYISGSDIQFGKSFFIEKYFVKNINNKLFLHQMLRPADDQYRIKKTYHIPPLSFYFNELRITQINYLKEWHIDL